MKEARRGSLRLRVVVSIVLATVGPLAVLGWRSYLTTRQAVEQSGLLALEDAVRQRAASLDALLSGYIDGVRVLAQNPIYARLASAAAPDSALTRAAIESMRSLARVDPTRIESVALLAPNGRLLAGTSGAEAGDEKAAWLRDAFAALHPVIATADDDGGLPSVAVFATQVRDARGIPIAVLRTRVRTGAFVQVMELGSSAFAGAGLIRLRDSTGNVIATWPVPRLNGPRPARLQWDEHPRTFEVRAEASTATGVRLRMLRHSQGSATLREAALRLSNAPWHLTASVDETVIIKPATAQAQELLLLATGLALVIAVLATVAGSRLATRIERLSGVAREFADGSLDVRAPASGEDEIGALGQGFNAMAERVQSLVHSLEARTKELEDDIAHRERLEAQLTQARKLEAVGQLAGGVAHDFNNVLTVILGTTEIIAGELGANHALGDELQSMEAAARRGADMTAQLLAFARRQRVEPRVVDVNAVVRESELLVRRLLGSRHRIALELAEEPIIVRIDPTQLTQVLLNLASNARDAMEDRAGVLTIATRVCDAPAPDAVGGVVLPSGSFGELLVADTGEGMSREVLQRVFEPFFTTKTVGRGTGLGLSSAFGIVGQAGGAIGVTSELERGTAFRIVLPTVGGEAISPTSVPARVEPQLRRGLKLLVLDDDTSVLKAVTAPLVQRGVQCTTAGDVDAGLAALSGDATFDAVISDVIMPGRTGLEFLSELRRDFPTLPVLLISGYTPDWPTRKDKYVGFLAKPFTTGELIQALSAVIEGSRTLPSQPDVTRRLYTGRN